MTGASARTRRVGSLVGSAVSFAASKSGTLSPWPASTVAAARRPPLSVGLTVKRLTRAAKALVATAARRTACLHVSRAMQAARRPPAFDFTSRLGRRAEAGPRRVLPRSCAAPGSFLTFSRYCSGHTDAAAHNISDLGFPGTWQNLCTEADIDCARLMAVMTREPLHKLTSGVAAMFACGNMA